MNDTTATPIEVGLDDGYAMTKIALSAGRVFSVPSRARVGVLVRNATSEVALP